MWVFVSTVLALVSARTQPGSSPRYHSEILRQSWTSLCEPIFDDELTCPPRHIMAIPRDIPTTVKSANFDRNSVGANTEALQGLAMIPVLECLKLNRNEITSIFPGAFVSLTMLNSLELQGNLLTVITRADFGDVPRLRQLQLQNNRLTQIETGAFSAMKLLESIFLDRNLVAGIEPRAWPRGGQLQAVSMSASNTNPSNCSFAVATDSVMCDCAAGFGGEDRTYCQLGATPHSEENPLPAVLGRTAFAAGARQDAGVTTAAGIEGELDESESDSAEDHPDEIKPPYVMGGVLFVVMLLIAVALMADVRKRPDRDHDRIVINHAAIVNVV